MLVVEDGDRDPALNPLQFSCAGIGHDGDRQSLEATLDRAAVLQRERSGAAIQPGVNALDGYVRARILRGRVESEHLPDTRALQVAAILFLQEIPRNAGVFGG